MKSAYEYVRPGFTCVSRAWVLSPDTPVPWLGRRAGRSPVVRRSVTLTPGGRRHFSATEVDFTATTDRRSAILRGEYFTDTVVVSPGCTVTRRPSGLAR